LVQEKCTTIAILEVRRVRRSDLVQIHIQCKLYLHWKKYTNPCKLLIPCFMSWNTKSQKCSICTKILFPSNFVHKLFSEQFSFGKIIQQPDMCGISKNGLNNMIIAQVHLVLGTIKGHFKMCIFVTQHNVTSFEGMCNWHADCRNVHHSCCQRCEC
jgi:hypothetical protein